MSLTKYNGTSFWSSDGSGSIYNNNSGDVYTSGNIIISGDGQFLVNGTPFDSGYSGATGATGATGSSGYSGQNGLDGQSGWSGWSGFSGLNGTNGTNGASGFSGYSGANGLDGSDGASGYSGYSGYSGLNGESGLDGTSFTWLGPWDQYNYYQINHVVEQSGSSYICYNTPPDKNYDPITYPEYWQLMADGQSGIGVPGGGSSGQILAKYSDNDFETIWVDNAGGNPFDQSLNTTDYPKFSGVTVQYIQSFNGMNYDSLYIDADNLNINTSNAVTIGGSEVNLQTGNGYNTNIGGDLIVSGEVQCVSINSETLVNDFQLGWNTSAFYSYLQSYNLNAGYHPFYIDASEIYVNKNSSGTNNLYCVGINSNKFIADSGYAGFGIQTEGQTPWSIYVNPSDSPNEPLALAIGHNEIDETFRIFASGNVGIGAAGQIDNGSVLQVEGGITATGLTINGVYSLPLDAGPNQYVLATDGAGGTAWTEIGAITNLFDQDLNTTNNVAFSGVRVGPDYMTSIPATPLRVVMESGYSEGIQVISNSSSDDAGMVLKPDLYGQYSIHAAGIQAINGTTGTTTDLELQGEGGNLWIGTVSGDFSGAKVQVTGGVSLTDTASGSVGAEIKINSYDPYMGCWSALNPYKARLQQIDGGEIALLSNVSITGTQATDYSGYASWAMVMGDDVPAKLQSLGDAYNFFSIQYQPAGYNNWSQAVQFPFSITASGITKIGGDFPPSDQSPNSALLQVIGSGYVSGDFVTTGTATANAFSTTGDVSCATINSQTPVADGTYTVGIGSSTNGTITISGGVIVSIQEAS